MPYGPHKCALDFKQRDGTPMKKPVRKLRCAVYTRKSTEEGLNQEFNSLDARRWLIRARNADG